MIVQAPGKIVAWGEYAVLAGAPAGVLAVNRYARVDLRSRASGWTFASSGLLDYGVHLADPRFCGAATARIAETILAGWNEPQLPRPFSLYTDSREFFDGAGQKLGLGSSAAVCNATYFGLAALLGRKPELDGALAAHRALQGGKGSGLDVAASWQGGAIRFQQGKAEPLTWPDQLHWAAIFTGKSAATAAHISRFESWRARGDCAALDDLCGAATALSSAPAELPRWRDYSRVLRALDQAASLNIYSAAHDRLDKLASEHDLVYKPCGAGGGDIGLVLSPDPNAVERFKTLARSHHFIPLDLEIAAHGVKLDN